MAEVPEPQDGFVHPLTEWFADARLWRVRHYGQSPRDRHKPPRRRAVVTMVRDEPVFLPIWLRYYSRYFRADDIHVLDHGSTDGSTMRNGFVRVPVSHETVDMTWMKETIESYQVELFDRYDTVLVTDVDEIVAPDPAWGTLGDYLDRFDEPFVNCLGYELLHLRDREAPFDPALPVLRQRGHWYANDDYDKPVLATQPIRWKPGFHRLADDGFNLDPDLRLIHLHRMDYDVCLNRHRNLSARPWSPDDVAAGRARHNRVTEEQAFERWFYTESSDAHIGIALERIPERWRGLF